MWVLDMPAMVKGRLKRKVRQNSCLPEFKIHIHTPEYTQTHIHQNTQRDTEIHPYTRIQHTERNTYKNTHEHRPRERNTPKHIHTGVPTSLKQISELSVDNRD